MRLAVIGTGIAGNAAAWTLSKHYPVTLISRAGGCCCSAIPASSATPSIRCRSISVIAPTVNLRSSSMKCATSLAGSTLTCRRCSRLTSATPACGIVRKNCSTSRPSLKRQCATTSGCCLLAELFLTIARPPAARRACRNPGHHHSGQPVSDLSPRSRFIQRYVFPGGMLPSPQILKALGERFGVPVIRECIFGQDYAKTLAIWRSNFRAAWPNLMPPGFDDPTSGARWEILSRLFRSGILVGRHRRASGGVRQIRLTGCGNRWLVCPAAVL
jgi:hypothetical protein